MSVHTWVFASSTSLPTILLLQRNILYNGFDTYLQSVCSRKSVVKVTGFISTTYKRGVIFFFLYLFFQKKKALIP